MTFSLLMILVFGKLLIWAIRAAWSIGRIIFTIVIVPIILIAMACTGLIYLALIILMICSIVAMVG
jgi:hypothetical protein